jgi:hypothetical protein
MRVSRPGTPGRSGSGFRSVAGGQGADKLALPANWRPVVLIAILCLAALLRLQNIDQPFIDYADWRQTSVAMMAENFLRDNPNILYPQTSWDGPGPSYQGREFQTVSYIASLLYRVVGVHDWVGRLVAVVFGLWGIFALYRLVSLVWDETRGLVAAAVLAVMPGAIFVDRSFLPDPAMVALVTTSVWLWVKYLLTDRFSVLLLAGFFGTWGFLTKLPGLVIGVPLLYCTASILSQRNEFTARRLARIAATAVCVLVPVVAYYLWAYHLSRTHPPYHFAGGGNWVWDHGVSAWLARDYFLDKLWWALDRWHWSKHVMLMVMVGILIPPGPASATSGSLAAPWTFHWWMVAMVIYYLIGAHEMLTNIWNLHLANPAAAALSANALVVVAGWGSRLLSRLTFDAARLGRLLAAIAIVAAVALVARAGQFRLPAMYSPGWKPGPNYDLGMGLRSVARSDDFVVVVAAATFEPVAIYYSGRKGWTFPPLWIDREWHGGGIPPDDVAIALFEELRHRGATLFGIARNRLDRIEIENPGLLAHLEATAERVADTPEYLIFRLD